MIAPAANRPPTDWILDELRQAVAGASVVTLIRRYVPLAVGWVLAYVAVHWHLVLPAHASATAAQVVTVGIIAAWYWVVTWVERRWPTLGHWLVSAGVFKLVPLYASPEAVASLRVRVPPAAVDSSDEGR